MNIILKIRSFLPVLLFCTVCCGQKINPAKLQNLLQRAEETKSEAIIIYQGQDLIVEQYYGIGHRDTLIEAMSTTKSVVGLAVACLLDDGLLESLDVPVCKFYPEWKQGMKKDITIRHLVTMTSGLQNVPNTSVEIYPSNNFMQLALCAELEAAPGSQWNYNNKSANLLAGVISKITGTRMDHYIAKRLFSPLGITKYNWSLDASGNPHGMSGCQIRPIDHIKFGLLLLNKGKYEGKQIIREEIIKQVTEPCPQFPRYGMLWWLEYENTVFRVDDELIRTLAESGVLAESLEKMALLKGDYSPDDFFVKAEAIFGPNPREALRAIKPAHIKMPKIIFEGNFVYVANGYLGNFIVVDPRANIVALRMTSEKSAVDENHFFLDFIEAARNLTE